MIYKKKNFKYDKKNPAMLHIKDKDRYKAFYEFSAEENRNVVLNSYKRNNLKFIVPKGDIIDVGCHVGYNVIYYAERGFNVTGVDISENAIRYATERVEKLSTEVQDRITLINSDISDLGDVGKYDTVILMEVLEHVIDPEEAFGRTVPLMKKDATLYVSAPCERIGNFAHVRGITEEWIINEGEKYGITFQFKNHKHKRGVKMRAIGNFK